jgi:hypothetical protein
MPTFFWSLSDSVTVRLRVIFSTVSISCLIACSADREKSEDDAWSDGEPATREVGDILLMQAEEENKGRGINKQKIEMAPYTPSVL